MFKCDRFLILLSLHWHIFVSKSIADIELQEKFFMKSYLEFAFLLWNTHKKVWHFFIPTQPCVTRPCANCAFISYIVKTSITSYGNVPNCINLSLYVKGILISDALYVHNRRFVLFCALKHKFMALFYESLCIIAHWSVENLLNLSKRKLLLIIKIQLFVCDSFFV